MRTTSMLRAALATGRTQWSASAYDALSARLIEEAGFDLVQTAGLAISASALGMPDAELCTMTENLQVVRACTAVTRLPIIADADTGYGNAVNVMRTVREFERAGVAGIALEDQVSPKRCPRMSHVDILPFDEAVGKIRAAVAAKTDPDFVIVARTDAEDDAEAIRRGKAFAEAGADLIMVIGKHRKDFAALRAIRVAVGKPLKVHVTGWLEDVDRRDIESIAGIAGFAHVALYSAVAAVRNNLAALRRDLSPRGLPQPQISREDFRVLIGFPEVDEVQRLYMPATGAKP